MITSLGQRGDAEKLEEIGFAGYLTKPVRQAQLYDCLELVLVSKPYKFDQLQEMLRNAVEKG